MKKALKKLMAAMLAVAMVMAMAVPAFAAGNPGKITIDNAVTGQKYTIYKILDLETNEDYTSYKYTPAAEWDTFIRTGAGSSYFSVDANNVVTWKDGVAESAAADLAAAAKAELTGKTAVAEKIAAGSSLTFDDLELGYYLVVSDLNNGVLCSLGTTKPTAEIKEKNGQPTIDKEVEHGSGSYGSANDATVGDTVNYLVTINVTDGNPVNYVMHDKMSSGLAFDGKVTVKVNGTLITEGYELVTETDDGDTFDVKFTNGTLKTNDVVTIEYSATLTKDAVVGSTGNDNKSTLEYGEHNRVDSTTRTYTWSFNIFKFFKDGQDEKALAGAEFVLYRKNGESVEYAQFDGDKIIGWTTEESAAGKRVSDGQKNIVVEGLANGTYYLKETKAPTGFNLLAEDVVIQITAENWSLNGAPTAKVLYNETEAEGGTVKVENKAGTTLPSTGGIGTTIFYVIGGGLMVAAAVLLVTKKRMEGKN